MRDSDFYFNTSSFTVAKLQTEDLGHILSGKKTTAWTYCVIVSLIETLINIILFLSFCYMAD